MLGALIGDDKWKVTAQCRSCTVHSEVLVKNMEVGLVLAGWWRNLGELFWKEGMHALWEVAKVTIS